MSFFLTRLKQLLRQKTNIFWTALFPIVLGVFFFFSFGRLEADKVLTKLDINVVDTSMPGDFYLYVNKLTDNDGEKLFEIKKIDDSDEAQNKLSNGEIPSYLFYKSGSIEFYRVEDSIDNNIIRTVIDNYLEIEILITQNPTLDSSEVIDNYNSINTIGINKNLSVKSPNILYFYSLIALGCLFATHWGTGIVTDVKADTSETGARLSISPTNKFKILFSYFMSAFVIQYLVGVILLVFLLALGVSFGSYFGWMFLLVAFGSAMGIAFGMLLGVLIRKAEYIRDWLAMAIALVSSFFAGLMNAGVKNIMDQRLPAFKYINPGSLINDGVLSLALYGDYNTFFLNIGLLSALIVLMFGFVVFRMRGEKYASL